MEPGFAVTIHKVQGRTLDKVILALSQQNGKGCGLDYRSVYVAFSRVRHAKDIRLLLTDKDGSQESMIYLAGMTGDPCNLAFVSGFRTDNKMFDGSKALQVYEHLIDDQKGYCKKQGNGKRGGG